MSFRLRAEEGRWIQTLESHEFISANFLSRDEWEDVIAADSPDPAAPETGPRLLDVVGVEDLRPLFRTVLQRTVIELELPSAARIEIAIEEGDIRGAEMDVSAPLCEIELASKSGDPAAVYEVALLLLKVAPLRIETLSKSDRGYRLVAPRGRRGRRDAGNTRCSRRSDDGRSRIAEYRPRVHQPSAAQRARRSGEPA